MGGGCRLRGGWRWVDSAGRGAARSGGRVEGWLAAADGQLVPWDRISAGGAVLRVALPLTPAPASRRDWAVHAIPVNLPRTVPAEARLCTPTLRVVGHRVRLDLPFTIAVATAPAAGHQVAVGVDWGATPRPPPPSAPS